MCGIVAGSYLDCDQKNIEQALASIQRRGPDDSRIHNVNAETFLAFNLLGINSKNIQSLRQPFQNAQGTLAVCVNGEIYNYQSLKADLEKQGCRFTTESDCEVVLFGLEIHGPSFLKKLNGEFAIVAYFSDTKTWLCAVDHVGTKPLKYYHENKSFAVASSAQALASLGIKLSLDSQSCLFAFHNVCLPMGKTLFKGIRTIPPAHYLVVKNGEAHLTKYSPEISTSKQSFAEVITDSIQERIPAQQKLALALSGGVDSSAIALYLKKMGVAFSCYSVDFPNSTYSEKKDIDAFCSRHDLATKYVSIGEEDLLSSFCESVKNAEHLVINAHSVGKLLLNKHLSQQGYRVCLTGDGADELFWGYEHFHAGTEFQFINDSNKIGAQYLSLLQPQYHADLGASNFFSDFKTVNPQPTAQDIYYNYWFNDYGLKILGDSQAANESLEYRYPFVDLNVLAHAQKNGMSQMDNFPSKKILRTLIATMDPDVASLAKRPFTAPLMGPAWMPLFEKYMLTEKFRSLDLFDHTKTWEYVSRLKEHHLPDGQRASSVLLSQLLSLAIIHHELCNA